MLDTFVCNKEEIKKIKDSMQLNDDLLLAAAFFKALSDPTRLSIVNALQVHGWLCVTDLSDVLNMSKSAVSHQLCHLRMCKLVRVKRMGQRVYYALSDGHVEQVFAMAVSHIKEDESE